MSSYLVNTNLTYTAVPATEGFVAGDHTVSWAFSDSTTLSGASVSKSWSTEGSHTAVVTATNTVTGGTATAEKQVVVANWSSRNWVSTGARFVPTATVAASLDTPVSHWIIISGKYFVNPLDRTTPSTITVFDTELMSSTQYSGLLGTIGTVCAACTLDSGAYTGQVLLVGLTSGRYGFFNPATGTLTLSPNLISTPNSFDNNVVLKFPLTKLPNGRWLFCGIAGIQLTKLYNPLTDTWSNADLPSGSNRIVDAFSLPSGNVLAIATNRKSYIYNYSVNTWSIGPTLLANTSNNSEVTHCKLPNGRVACMPETSSPNTPHLATWGEGEAGFTVGIETFPLLTLNPGATVDSSFQNIMSTGDGNIICLGGYGSNGSIASFNSKTGFGMFTAGSAWIVGPNLPSAPNGIGTSMRACMYGGKVWRMGSSGILYYLAWS